MRPVAWTFPRTVEELVSLCASKWTGGSGSHGSSLTTRLWWLCSGCFCSCCHRHCLTADTFFPALFSSPQTEAVILCLSGSPPGGPSFLGFFWELVELTLSLCCFFWVLFFFNCGLLTFVYAQTKQPKHRS